MTNYTYKNNAPIGVFDSGIGGLTVARALADEFANEQFIYIGDTIHMPYGLKSTQALINYSMGICQYLYESGCKMVIIACNTASAAAYDELSNYWAGRMLIVDVISPLVDFIAQKNFTKVGVIATKATIRSDIYAKKLWHLSANLEVASLATSLLAQMIEEGFYNNQISKAVLNQYLSYPDFEDIEALLLACTHYPLIKPQIIEYFGNRIQIFDSIEPVVQKVKQILYQQNLLRTQPIENKATQYQFLVSDYTQGFQHSAKLFYKQDIPLQKFNWEGDKVIVEY